MPDLPEAGWMRGRDAQKAMEAKPAATTQPTTQPQGPVETSPPGPPPAVDGPPAPHTKPTLTEGPLMPEPEKDGLEVLEGRRRASQKAFWDEMKEIREDPELAGGDRELFLEDELSPLLRARVERQLRMPTPKEVAKRFAEIVLKEKRDYGPVQNYVAMDTVMDLMRTPDAETAQLASVVQQWERAAHLREWEKDQEDYRRAMDTFNAHKEAIAAQVSAGGMAAAEGAKLTRELGKEMSRLYVDKYWRNRVGAVAMGLSAIEASGFMAQRNVEAVQKVRGVMMHETKKHMAVMNHAQSFASYVDVNIGRLGATEAVKAVAGLRIGELGGTAVGYPTMENKVLDDLFAGCQLPTGVQTVISEALKNPNSQAVIQKAMEEGRVHPSAIYGAVVGMQSGLAKLYQQGEIGLDDLARLTMMSHQLMTDEVVQHVTDTTTNLIGALSAINAPTEVIEMVNEAAMSDTQEGMYFLRMVADAIDKVMPLMGHVDGETGVNGKTLGAIDGYGKLGYAIADLMSRAPQYAQVWGHRLGLDERMKKWNQFWDRAGE